MPLVIKNIILYDEYGHVIGFCELKNAAGENTAIKIKHNLQSTKITVFLSTRDREFLIKIHSKTDEGQLPVRLNLIEEIVVRLVEKNGDEESVVASGVINENRGVDEFLHSPVQTILSDTENGIIRNADEIYNTATAREIDEVLRSVCTLGDDKTGICEMCPYRVNFYDNGNVAV